MKRLFDIFFTLPGTVLLAPVMACVAIWVRLDSRGPILFRQTRVGQHGRPFQVLKFRTMRPEGDRGGLKITAADDPRITRCGRLLRRYKLDELPQLINVLRGDMSLVGPRPEVPEYVARYPSAIRDAVLSLRPGITDFAALEFRNETELLRSSVDPEQTYLNDILPTKLALYERYIQERSILIDLKLILSTLRAILD
jgi:lipopolysaccharide/colanic/teichoic acid biosynthesis glycosyltransferase